jgi:hypothetical protein
MHDTRGFDRAELASGESKSVSMTLDPRVFSDYDVRSKAWKIDAGPVHVFSGRQFGEPAADRSGRVAQIVRTGANNPIANGCRGRERWGLVWIVGLDEIGCVGHSRLLPGGHPPVNQMVKWVITYLAE